MEKDLVKMFFYGSCARGDFKEYSDVDIALLTKGKWKDKWKYDDKIDEVATELALKYFAVVNFVLLSYDEFEEKKSWYGYFKNIDREGIKLYGWKGLWVQKLSGWERSMVINLKRLEAFEAMMKMVLEQSESEKNLMDKLKMQGKEKSATYRQYMGNRLFYVRMIELYKEYGLLEW